MSKKDWTERCLEKLPPAAVYGLVWEESVNTLNLIKEYREYAMKRYRQEQIEKGCPVDPASVEMWAYLAVWIASRAIAQDPNLTKRGPR